MKSKETSRSQHLIKDSPKFQCFWYQRAKSKCSSTKNCNFQNKADKLIVNLLEVVAAKIQNLKWEMHRRRTVGETNHAIQGEMHQIEFT